MQLDHVTIRTRDIAGTREFFRAVFGLELGHRPAAVHRTPGCWMYAEGQALVHLIGSQGYGIERAAEALDHVSFHLTGYADFRAMLDRAAITLPARRHGRPEDIAAAYLFAIDNPFDTGSVDSGAPVN